MLKLPGERIANEILMHFRSQRKSAQDVSLSDYIETGNDGAPLELMEVISEEGDLLDQITNRETVDLLRRAVDTGLSEQERLVVRLFAPGRPACAQMELDACFDYAEQISCNGELLQKLSLKDMEGKRGLQIQMPGGGIRTLSLGFLEKKPTMFE